MAAHTEILYRPGNKINQEREKNYQEKNTKKKTAKDSKGKKRRKPQRNTSNFRFVVGFLFFRSRGL
jgi:hypothetical protein